MITKLIKKRRQLPLVWHFALTIVVVGTWVLVIAGPTLTGDWVVQF